MKLWLLLAGFLTLTGCVTYPKAWYPAGTLAQYQRDSYECHRDAELIVASLRKPDPPPSYSISGHVYQGGYISGSATPESKFSNPFEPFIEAERLRNLYVNCMQSHGHVAVW